MLIVNLYCLMFIFDKLYWIFLDFDVLCMNINLLCIDFLWWLYSFIFIREYRIIINIKDSMNIRLRMNK